MKKVLKRFIRKFGFEIIRYSQIPRAKKIISLEPANGCKGNVLLAYITAPFLLKPGEPVSNKHTHDWESLQMARTFTDLGYAVDVIDYLDKDFIPKKDYSFFISARTYFEEIGRRLNKDCVKIVHLETSHFLFNNAASYRRHLNLQQRRGITLTSLKWVKPNWAVEYADAATIKGNQFTSGTYSYAGKPFFLTPNPASISLPWPADKKFENCRKNFLWFGSDGFVHKGLDLVLEVFAAMPDHNLTVCGPINKDKNFEKAYCKELYQTPNIRTIGWVDVDSLEFAEVINNCIGLVYPSCAEGQAGSVVNCLQAALIPIVSCESGVDVNDFGISLRNCSIDEIKKSILAISGLTEERLKLMARKCWEYARENHTREKFAEKYRTVVENIIKGDFTAHSTNRDFKIDNMPCSG